MTAFLDTFTGVDGTDITAHTADSGESWTYHPTSVASPSIVLATNRLRANKAGDLIVYSSWTPAAADYDVEADLFVFTVAATPITGVFGRGDTVARTSYWFGYQASDLKWHIFKNVAGVFTDLGTPLSQTLTVSQTYKIRLEMRGTLIRGFVDGVVAVSATDSGIASAGKCGVWTQGAASNSTGMHLDRITGIDLQTIVVTDSNLFWSPGSWFTSGSTYKQSANPGAYLKFAISGTTQIGFKLDLTPLSAASISTAEYPKITYSVNSGVPVTVEPTTSFVTMLTSGTAASTYTVEITFISSKQTNDRWTTPANVCRIVGVLADGAGATVSSSGTAAAVRTKNALVYGDSITEGVESLGVNTGDLTSNDGRQTWVRYAMMALNAEYGQIGFGFQGFVHTGNGNVPKLASSYNLYHTGQSRTMTGYDYIFVNMGTNDTAALSATLAQVDVTGFLTSLRSSIGSTARIFVIVPFSQVNQSTIAAAVVTARLTDSLITLIDLGTAYSYGLLASTGATDNSPDGLHPNQFASAKLGAAVAQKVQIALTPYATAETCSASAG